MTVRKIEIERLTITLSRSFETVVAALEARSADLTWRIS
jgi:hypothetical protein